MTERITTSHDVLLVLHDELDAKDAEIAALRKAVQQALSFVEKVTHWQECRPDKQDTLASLRAAIAQAVQPV